MIYLVFFAMNFFVSHELAAMTLSSTKPDSQGNFTLSWPSPSNGNSVYKVYEYLPSTNTESLIEYVRAPRISLKRPGGRHYFFVVAIGRAPDARYPELTVEVPLAKPPKISSFSLSNTGSTYDTDGSIKLNWGSVSHAKRYKIRYRKNGGSFSYKTSTSTSFTLSGLSDGTWEFWVKADNIGANNYVVSGSYSNVRSKKVMKKPGTPPSLKASESPSLDGTFRLSWGTSSNRVTKYQYQRQYSSGNWSSFYSTGLNRHLDVSKGDGTYTYQVRACNEASCGNKSKVTITVMKRPGVPVSLKTSESKSNDGTYKISWSQPANRVTYYRWRVRKNAGSWSSWKNNSRTTYFNRSDSDGKYDFHVAACNEHSCSSSGSVSTEVIKKPTMPSSFSSSESNSLDGTFTLSWSASSNQVTRYEWRVRKNSGSWSSFTSNGTSRNLNQSKSDGVYDYQVRACNTLSCSGIKSTSVSVLRIPGSPQNLTADTDPVRTGEVKISWGAASNTVSYYKYQYKMVRDTQWSFEVNVGTKRYLKKSLPDNDYVFIVYACNASGCSNAPGIVVRFDYIEPVRNLGADKTRSSDGNFTLSWGGVTDAESYKWREKKNAGAWSGWYSQSGTSKKLNREDGSYEYEVKACIGGACSITRSTDVQVLRKPSNLTLSVSDDISLNGEFTITWLPINETIEWVEYKFRQLGVSNWTNATRSSSKNQVSDARVDGAYEYQVFACNQSGCSSGSIIAVEVVKTPGPILNLRTTVAETTTGTFSISWSKPTVNRTTHYEWRELRQGANSQHDFTRTNETWLDFDDKPDGEYSYEVKACNSGSCGEKRVVQVDVLSTPSQPAGFTSSANPSEDGNFTLSWNKSSGSVSHYELSEKLSAGAWSSYINVNKVTSSVQSKESNGLYMFRVRACNRLSCSISTQISVSVDSNLSACTDSPAADSSVEIAYSYDALGRLTKVTDSTGCNREYTLDAAGNRMEVIFTN